METIPLQLAFVENGDQYGTSVPLMAANGNIKLLTTTIK